MSPRRDPVAHICLAAAAAWAVLAAWHAWHAHLLADDYAIVAQTSDASIRQILTTDLFTFYRPLGALIVKAIAWALAPSHAGWSLFMLSMHVGNTVLVASVAARLFGERRAAWPAATMFLLSPWAAEGYLWLGPVFDVGTTGCTLAAVRLALAATTRERAAPWWCGAAACCGLAAGFKESGLLSPLIVAGVLLVDDRRVWRSAAAWAAGAGAALLVVLVFAMRSAVVVDTSTYTVSGYVSLMTTPAAGAAFISALLALMAWPVPDTLAPAGPWLNVLMVWPVGFALLPVLIASVLLDARRLMPLALVTALTYLPTAFFHLAVASITPRRYLYLSGATWALLVGGALARVRSARGWRSAAPVAVAAVLAAGLTSLAAQVRLWTGASRIARCAVEDFGRTALGRDTPIYVDNVPFVVDNGPFIVIDYDFHYAYRERWNHLDVAYRMATLHVDRHGRFHIAGYGPDAVDADSRERVTLELCLDEPRHGSLP